MSIFLEKYYIFLRKYKIEMLKNFIKTFSLSIPCRQKLNRFVPKVYHLPSNFFSWAFRALIVGSRKRKFSNLLKNQQKLHLQSFFPQNFSQDNSFLNIVCLNYGLEFSVVFRIDLKFGLFFFQKKAAYFFPSKNLNFVLKHEKSDLVLNEFIK